MDNPEAKIELAYLGGTRGGLLKIVVDGTEAGSLSYSSPDDGVIAIDHTFVSPEYQGQGLARRLMEAAVSYARENKLKIIPLCSYAASYFAKEASARDVLLER